MRKGLAGKDCAVSTDAEKTIAVTTADDQRAPPVRHTVIVFDILSRGQLLAMRLAKGMARMSLEFGFSKRDPS